MILSTDTSAMWLDDDGWSLNVTYLEAVQNCHEYQWFVRFESGYEVAGRGLLGPSTATAETALQVFVKFLLADGRRFGPDVEADDLVTGATVASWATCNIGTLTGVLNEVAAVTGKA